MPDFNPEEILGEGDSLQWSSPLIALADGLAGPRFEAGMFGSVEKMLPTNLMFRKLDQAAEREPTPRLAGGGRVWQEACCEEACCEEALSLEAQTHGASHKPESLLTSAIADYSRGGNFISSSQTLR